MKRILAIAFLVLSLQAGAQNLTGTPAASADAPEWVAGKTTYFNYTPGGQLGNMVVVKQNGLPGLWNNQFGGEFPHISCMVPVNCLRSSCVFSLKVPAFFL